MAVFKCKMCGGSLEVKENESIAVCEYCATRQTLPKIDDEKLLRLHDRANDLRLEKEFDKATGIYESIIADCPEDAEAYWCLVLCKYGIEYIDDPRTHKRIPTVNRASRHSVFDDRNYHSAVKYADSYQRDIYISQAKEIDAVLKGILAISAKTEPYDIFICYKETDVLGSRTPDSVYAQDIYNSLTKEGYKVFFSRISLEDKLGQQYEPYIFSALQSSKVMLVVGTSSENFNAVWVKNEWSRFLALCAADSSKTLIPCYRDMSPYDMPEEFKYLQSQDMGKIGYIQDLMHGISKLNIKPAAQAPQPAARAAQPASQAAPITINQEALSGYAKKLINGVESFITGVSPTAANAPQATMMPIDTADPEELTKRSFACSVNADWANASRFADAALQSKPDLAEAHLAKLIASYNVRQPEQLAVCQAPYENSLYYRQALNFGDEQLKKQLTGYVDARNAHNEEMRKSNIYSLACNTLRSSTRWQALENAARDLNSISGYKDSEALAKQCSARAADLRKDETYFSAVNAMAANKISKYNEAISLFTSIEGWKDSSSKIAECKYRIEELKRLEEIKRIEKEKRKEETKVKLSELKRKAIIGIIIALIIAFVVIIAVYVVVPLIASGKVNLLYSPFLSLSQDFAATV